MTTESEAKEQQKYNLCLACGCLKQSEYFEVGSTMCGDCHEADATDTFREAPDGDGFVKRDDAVCHEAES